MVPLVSIILSQAYNLESLKQSLDSLQSQTNATWEIIMPIQSVNVEIEESFKGYKDISYIEIPESQNNNSTLRNRCLLQAKGNYVCFMSEEDLWEHNRLQKLVNLIEAQDCELVYCGIKEEINHYDFHECLEEYPAPNHCGDMKKRILLSSPISLNTILFKRKALIEIGLFDENLKIFEDYDLLVRLAQRKPFFFLNEILGSSYMNNKKAEEITKIIVDEEIDYIYTKHKSLYIQSNISNKALEQSLNWRNFKLNSLDSERDEYISYWAHLFPIRGAKNIKENLNQINQLYFNKVIKGGTDPLLTIIIPHHNIPSLLERCLESIPVRTDLQVIVVDDGSASEIVNHPDFPPYHHFDVELYRLEQSKGGGAARNFGLKYARGKWITFVDADDRLTPLANDIIDSLNKVSEEIDVIYHKAGCFNSIDYSAESRVNNFNRIIEDAIKGVKDGENLLRYRFGEPWCKIVRKSLIDNHNIHFEETSIHNDTQYSYLVGYYANKIMADTRAWCDISVRTNSVSTTLSDLKKLDRMKVFAKTERFYIDHNISLKYCFPYYWNQLCEVKNSNPTLYQKGIEIGLRNGFSKSYIKRKVFKAQIRRLLSCLLKQSKNFFNKKL